MSANTKFDMTPVAQVSFRTLRVYCYGAPSVSAADPCSAKFRSLTGRSLRTLWKPLGRAR